MVDEKSDSDISDEALATANDLEKVLHGRSTSANYLAIAMVLGHSASEAERPNLNELMRLIKRAARHEFERYRQRRVS